MAKYAHIMGAKGRFRLYAKNPIPVTDDGVNLLNYKKFDTLDDAIRGARAHRYLPWRYNTPGITNPVHVDYY